MASQHPHNSYCNALVQQIDRLLAEDQKMCDIIMQLKDEYKNGERLKGHILISGSAIEGLPHQPLVLSELRHKGGRD